MSRAVGLVAASGLVLVSTGVYFHRNLALMTAGWAIMGAAILVSSWYYTRSQRSLHEVFRAPGESRNDENANFEEEAREAA